MRTRLAAGLKRVASVSTRRFNRANRFSVTGALLHGVFTGACIFATVVATPHAAGAEGDFRPDPREFVAPSRQVDVIHTRLELDLDLKAQTIAGNVQHRISPLKQGVREIRLNCVALEVAAVELDGKAVDFEHPVPGEQTTSWIEGADATNAADLLVVRTGDLERGHEYELRITYSGAPKQGLYFIPTEKGIPEKRHEVWSQGEAEDNRFWIPCFDYPNDKATYEGIFRVEKGDYVLSNGALVSQNDVDDKTEYHWRLATPQVSYLIMVAAGDYNVIERESEGVPLLYVVPPDTKEETVERCYGITADMMTFFNDYIGIDYPFEKYAQVVVQDFIYGGMENTTATVMNTRTLYSESRGLTSNEDGLIAHELAHQWWGDLVTCDEWSHLWLNEGFATYWQSLYRRHRRGDDDFRYLMDERYRLFIAKDKADPRPVVVDFFNRKDSRNSAHVYRKGASVLHMLHFLLGEDMFRASAKHFAETFAYKTARTSDFINTVRETTGENLDWFFEQWLYMTGYPALKATKSWDTETNTLKLTISQTQEVTGLTPLFRLPMDIEITTDDEVELHRVVVERESQDFYFSLPTAPKIVIVDKGDWTLKSLEFPKLAGELIYQLENGEAMERVHAARSLGKTAGSTVVVEALERCLVNDNEFWGVRREVALALGRLGTNEAIVVLTAASGLADARVRLAVAEALGKTTPSDDVTATLTGYFAKDAAVEVRARAVTSLAQVESPRATRTCLDALKIESDRGAVRNAGLEGLVKMRATDELKRVKPLTTPGNPRRYRHTAMTSYAKLAKRLTRESDREDAALHLAAMLDDWHVHTRATAIAALKDLGEVKAVEPLMTAAQHDPVPYLRARAASAARAIQTGSGEALAKDDLETQMRRLNDQIETLKKDLQTLQRRTPRPEDDGRLTRKEE